jgi:cbb3-type cytochrome c oxidase subunit III
LQSPTKFAFIIGIGTLLAGTSYFSGAAATTGSAPDGERIFAAKCSACHQVTGLGNGPYPPLAKNPYVTADNTAILITTVINGRSGPISVNGRSYGGVMPAWRGQLSNAEIAAVLTYIRSAWTNNAAAVTENQVAIAAAPRALSGERLFAAKCSTCHQTTGLGTGTYPPLAGNRDVVSDDPKGMVATIVNGRSGPLTVNGKAFNSTMPSWKGSLSNADIAAVGTYVRSAWGNAASGVTEQQVSAAGTSVSTVIGASLYSRHCASCHNASGKGGGGGMFPALAGDSLVTNADPIKMLSMIEHGRTMMPSWKGQLSAGDIAAVATYIRSAWGNSATPVTEQDVAAVK